MPTECEVTIYIGGEDATVLAEPPDLDAPFPVSGATAYAVMGSTGEYSDRSDWMVCAYTDESLARAHAERAEYVARAIYVQIKATRGSFCDEKKNPHDPKMEMDYTGTSYTVVPMPLVLEEARHGNDRERA